LEELICDGEMAGTVRKIVKMIVKEIVAHQYVVPKLHTPQLFVVDNASVQP
jgi:hypothetical protein